MRVFLAPRSNETSHKNFLSTIENGIDYSIVEPFLDAEGKRVLAGRKKLFVWGNRDTKVSSWEKMEPGDLVLFYKGREGNEKEGKIVYAGKLLYKKHSLDMGLALWPPKKDQEPWTCVFMLKDLQPVHIPISEIISLADYKDNFVVQGFMPLNETGTTKLLEKYGSGEEFIKRFNVPEGDPVSDLEIRDEINAHSEAQLLLLKIGRLLNYDTYSPDRSKQGFGEELGGYCTLSEIPTRFLGELVPIIKQIDVIWFKDDIPKCAFEIEHTTKFSTGFQRLFQLNALSSKLFIVSSQSNYPLYEKFIEADPYYKHKNSFFFRSYKQLEDYFRAVSEFNAVNETFLGR